MKLPLARFNDLIEQEAGEELLLFDLRTGKAHNLNATAKIIFQACDGKTSTEKLKRNHDYSGELIFLALDQLSERDLLESNVYETPFSRMNRRQVIRKVGLSAVVALPLISSIVAPPPAAAASCLPGGTPISVPPQATQMDCNNAMVAFAAANCCSGSSGGITYDLPMGSGSCTAVCAV